ncbi:AAA family ATPase [Clostridium botulinum]|uniref:AAA family ATPase n=1 Tax=Clostridium botulinum TaxID=1491 RepID=UPI0004D78102|nr:AAA family ATPase [Clostridium botulinum]KEI04170.1 hypothetical protein Z952_07350 [Clostridium botulinum C/D str. BKT75002]KEI11536.1 hypothetical protein Z954_07610 [Clostridium botulinum C/D str. BKT2873]OOV59337.1 hypothetical protein B1A68_05730 [Clostridium botulinum D/C]
MTITRVSLENFTVFNKLDLDFSDGINIFIGENGCGKTHLMKAIYSACQAVRTDISFPHKLVRVFKPDDLRIGRLTKRKAGNGTTKMKFFSESTSMEC